MPEKPSGPKSLKTISVKDRHSKVSVRDFASPPHAGMGVGEFLDGLPRILAGRDLLALADLIAFASSRKKQVLAGLGAHVIKVGLNPVMIAWMKEKILTGLVLNGACVIHDVEIAMWGRTSEDVAPSLDQGTFGSAGETAELINHAVKAGAKTGMGFGLAVAHALKSLKAPFAQQSLLCQALEHKIPLTVHVALGTDIIHMHPSADGSAIGKTSMDDFHQLVSLVGKLEGGVYLNMGSAVILPEVFLKALSLARNQGHKVKDFTTANMDFLRHYRSTVNVVERPVRLGGRGFQLIGHHELNLPLLTAAVFERLPGSNRGPGKKSVKKSRKRPKGSARKQG